MASLRIRVELNKGGHGIVLDKLAAVTQHTVAFLHAFGSDLGLGDVTRKWLAENFDNNSVDFDCRFTPGIDASQVNRCRRALRLVFANDYSDAELSVVIRPETRRQFARIAAPIDPDEKVRFGIYPDDAPQPSDWFELTKDLSQAIEEPLTQTRESFGEIQCIVHAFFKEAERPYLKVRELSTKQLVNCYFRAEMYQSAVEVLKDPNAVLLVEGWTRDDPESGYLTEIDVTDFHLAPDFSLEAFNAAKGSMPDYTGSQTTSEFLERLRHE